MSNNGPSFTDPTYAKKRPRREPLSPEQRQAQLEQDARDCADRKLFSTDPASWLRKHKVIK